MSYELGPEGVVLIWGDEGKSYIPYNKFISSLPPDVESGDKDTTLTLSFRFESGGVMNVVTTLTYQDARNILQKISS